MTIQMTIDWFWVFLMLCSMAAGTCFGTFLGIRLASWWMGR